MSGLKFEIPGTIAAPRLGKAGPMEFIRNPDGTSPLFAAYLHGTDAHVGTPSEGAPRTDLSGNGHTLTQIGANGTNIGQDATGFKGTNPCYLQTPFNHSALADSGVPNEFAAMHFAVHPGPGGVLWGTRAAVGSSGFRYDMGSSSAYNASHVLFFDAANQQAVIDNPIPAWRATDAFMFGMSVQLASKSLTAFRGHRGDVGVNGQQMNTILGVSSASPIRIGQRSANTWTGTISYATLLFNRALTPAETRRVYAGVRALIVARVGVDV